MKKWRDLSDRMKFLNGLYALGLGAFFYLVDCALASKNAGDVFWLARGIYHGGPAGFLITLPLLASGLGISVFHGLKLRAK